MTNDFLLYSVIGFVVGVFVLYEVINMATATRKKLYNQEQQIFLLKRIVQLLENEKNKTETVNPEG